MNPLYLMPELTCFANDNDALIPEVWAVEALRVLGSHMVMGQLVNRDYSDQVASFGDVVNTSRPADFKGKRKTDADDVVDQDAVSPNIPVPLDQHIHVSFVIKDGERSKSLPDLIKRYLEPAAREMAETIDRVLTGQVARLSANERGILDEMDSTNAADFILDAHTEMNINRAPKTGRNLVLGPRAEGEALKADIVVSTEKRGDAGTALRTASLGTIYGFDTFMDQNVNYVDNDLADTDLGVTDGAELAGAGVSSAIDTTVSNAGLAIAGEYVWFEGEGRLHRIASHTNNPADITLVTGLANAIVSGADVRVFTAGAVDLVANYAAGWSKEIALDGFATGKEMQVGQLLTFGLLGSSHTYTVISIDDASADGDSLVLLDRPLDASIDNDDECYPGPAGGINVAFHRDAVALVTRPLVEVGAGTGAISVVANFDGLSMRVVMQYDSKAQGTRVTFDLLAGVAILDDRLAVSLYS